jgi:hypothetical protein
MDAESSVYGSLHEDIIFIHHECQSVTGCCTMNHWTPKRIEKEIDTLKRACGECWKMNVLEAPRRVQWKSREVCLALRKKNVGWPLFWILWLRKSWLGSRLLYQLICNFICKIKMKKQNRLACKNKNIAQYKIHREWQRKHWKWEVNDHRFI